MISFVQVNFVALLGAAVAGTVVWAVVSSLVPPRRHKMTLLVRGARPEGGAPGVRRTAVARS